MVRPLTLVLAGPTASGKTSLALRLAERFSGEIVCGDSRQIYQGMQIGSAGPNLAELTRVPHHGYARLSPTERYDAARFIADTDAYVAEIHARHHLAIVVGGAGLYLRAYRFGLDHPGRDDAIRKRLEAELSREGAGQMHARLAAVDEESAKSIEVADGLRIVRALEIFEVTGQKPSAKKTLDKRAPPRQPGLYYLLQPARPWLVTRIAKRAASMFAGGLLDEALALRRSCGAHKITTTMGYQEALALSDGAMTQEAAIERTTIRHRQYSKRQTTWFKSEPWWTRIAVPAEDAFEIIAAGVVAAQSAR